MALPPQKFREAVFQILYSHAFGVLSDEIISFMMQELKTTRRAMTDAQGRVNQIVEKTGELDALITAASTEYSFERISGVEKTILRLGLYEIMFDSAIPAKVAIAEGVRLCRK
ncbi:MAG TPA: transcription antitermination factor NusB, partial [Chlamydiales bacterium]|nr:transcription antitermination factor NusB [Chlamydiales bacterium]